ncbi:MAG: cell division protein ZapA [Bauldia sp.]
MASVSVTINGRKYQIGCEPGQEQHILDLALGLDRKIGELRGAYGEMGDLRLIVMAAIMTADEGVESHRRVGFLEHELDRLQKRGAADEQRQESSDADLARAIGNAAKQIADLARRINAEE